MDKQYHPAGFERDLYSFWEARQYCKAVLRPDKKPFSIVLPPPNANADLHLGHAMYVYEDIMIRYKQMGGDATLWLPGADHAGFETQFVFEKHLKKQGKSRFDYDRETLYRMIWDFVQENRGKMENQLQRLGFLLDWSKIQFTLDKIIIRTVHQTFKKLYDDGLIYRSKRLVNFCTKCGTGFSDLEVKHIEQNDPIYYLKYGPFVLATVRPETKFGDTAVVVHPKDKRYAKWIGKTIEFEGLTGKISLKVIADEAVDPKFGTGVVKITPAHDSNDFEMGKRHNLEIKQVIGFNGSLMPNTGPYAGLKVKAARAKVVADLQAKGLIDHIDEKYTHMVGTCYKCGTVLEPLPISQWYIKVKPLAQKAIEALQKKETEVIPKRFEKTAIQWLANFHDWNISRQIVWGIRIPAWRCKKCDVWTVTEGDVPHSCQSCGASQLVQDTDIFDTWFSSGQWPVATLKGLGEDFFDYFYPTSVMETGYDILPWWVCRMMMLGIYMTGRSPFKVIYLHGLVRDSKGAKMSKSKGNVVNPMVMVDKYGADALRAALVFQTSAGRDLSFSEDKVVGMRNFTNKVWNVGRFIYMNRPNQKSKIKNQNQKVKTKRESSIITQELIQEMADLKKKVVKHMDLYQFSAALDEIYKFIWHRFADVYIEKLKEAARSGNIETQEALQEVYLRLIVLLHPFMPFVTEAVWKAFNGKENSILEQQYD